MKQLSTLKKIPIRDIWKREPEFSAWLAQDENMALLSQEIGIELQAEETEADVGIFSADILAKDRDGLRTAIIENQYDYTNHDHLGKLITYAAGRDAEILIWIVENARDEHRAAVQWLNDHTEMDIGVFLVQIKVFVIGDSAPAPHFTVLESPNDWVKTNRQRGQLSERGKKQLLWWQSFMDYAMKQTNFKKEFKYRNALGHAWMDLPVNTEYHLVLAVTLTQIGVWVYIHQNKELFKHFLEHKDEIEHELGCKLDWQFMPNNKASKIVLAKNGDFKELTLDEHCFSWYCEKAIALKKNFQKYEI